MKLGPTSNLIPLFLEQTRIGPRQSLDSSSKLLHKELSVASSSLASAPHLWVE